jgi:serine/threonine-protein kinase SRPK3
MSKSQHPSAGYVVQLIDSFEHPGPNGIHLCLVLELMSQTVSSFLEGYAAEIRLAVAKKFTSQLLRGLEFLDSCGVIHNGQATFFRS